SVLALRAYWRQRQMQVRYAASHAQHMQKAMEQINVKLTQVVSDITGVTGMLIIGAILEGERDPVKLAQLRDERCQHSEEQIALALQGTGLSQEGGFPGGSLWTIPLETCSIVGELTPIGIDGGSPMSAITQRIASAFVVLCGRYGDVTKMAHDREQSRQSLYREASQVANAVDGTAVQSRIDELQRQLAGQQAQIQDLQ